MTSPPSAELVEKIVKKLPQKLFIKCPAKINRWLVVDHADATGFHPLLSHMVPIDLFDDMQIEFSKGKGVTCKVQSQQLEDAEIAELNDNLQANTAVRASTFLLQAIGLADLVHVSIIIDKNIPMKSGLGGGSSNAGNLICAFQELLGKETISDELAYKTALFIGSDVPFSLNHKPAIVSGYGEILRLFEDKERKFSLILPQASVSTVWAYKSLDKSRNIISKDKIPNLASDTMLSEVASDLQEAVLGENIYQEVLSKMTIPEQTIANSFEPVVRANFVEIDSIFTHLSTHWNVQLSGSGSTIFVEHPADKAEQQHQQLAKAIALLPYKASVKLVSSIR